MKEIDLTLFGKVYDLTEDLSSEAPVIKIGDEEFKIDTGFKKVMELDKVFKKNKGDFEFIKDFLEISLGKDQAKILMDKNFPMQVYKKIIKIIGDEIKGTDDESSGNAN